MGEADAGPAAGRVLAALRGARRSEVTIGRYQVVLGRFAAFLSRRGLDSASDQVCVDFIASQTGTRLGSLHERVQDKRVQAVRRAAVLMAGALAGRELVVDQSVIPAKDCCPARFSPLRDDYVASLPRAATPRRPWPPRTRRPAGSWATWRRRAPAWPASACGTCRASCCASAGCGARPSRA